MRAIDYSFDDSWVLADVVLLPGLCPMAGLRGTSIRL